MKPKLGYLPVDSMYPHQGLNTNDPSTMMDPKYSPDCSDVTFTDGDLVKRKGYAPLGNVPDANVVMALIPFQTTAGVNFLVRVTTAKQHYYRASDNTWVDITTVDTWNGADTDQVSWVTMAGTDVGGRVLVITNGKNRPQVWDGVNANFRNALAAPYSWNYPGTLVTCGWLATMNDHLIMGNITVTGPSVAPQDVAWSDAGKCNEWLTGTAGAQTLFDTIGTIQCIIPLAGRLIVYANDSIHTMTYVGGDLIYVFERLLEDTRLVGPRTIVNLGPYHVFLSQDNVQLFDGSRTTPTVAMVIHQTYRGELATNYRHRAFGFLDRSRKRVYFGVPISSTVTKVYVLEYSVVSDYSIYNAQSYAQWRWVPHLPNTILNTMGFYTQDNDLFWNSLLIATTNWNQMSGSWQSGAGNKGFPSRVIGDRNGNVFLADDTSANDNGVAIASHWDSIDITIPQEYQSEFGRFTQIEAELRGVEVDVSYSRDQGGTFVSVVTDQQLTSQWKTYRFYIDTVSRTLRVRLTNNYLNSNFELKWLRVWVSEAGPY